MPEASEPYSEADPLDPLEVLKPYSEADPLDPPPLLDPPDPP